MVNRRKKIQFQLHNFFYQESKAKEQTQEFYDNRIKYIKENDFVGKDKLMALLPTQEQTT